MELSARDLMAALPAPAVLADQDGKIALVNDAMLALTGYAREELAGRPAGTLFGDTGAAALRRKSGGVVPGKVLSAPVSNAAGLREGTLFVVHDAERLMAASRLAALGRMAGGVAHELNNPLSVILGFAQCVVRGMRRDDPDFEPLDSIEKEAQRCKELIANLLAFSRPARAEKEARDVNDSVERVLSLVQARAKMKNVAVVRHYGGGIPYVPLNVSRFGETVAHLCSNALDAMPEGGTLTVSTEVREGRIAVTVADTGTGMTEDVKKHLFKPLFTTKPAGDGMGLGLAISREIIEEHGGRIEAESEGPGKGSRFTITLPLK